jgi:hypothetical protein
VARFDFRTIVLFYRQIAGHSRQSENFHAIVPQDALRAQGLDENLEKITRR